MNRLPTIFRRLFQGIHALITATFVCTVAYAATYGAFGPSDTRSIDDPMDCEQQVQELQNTIVSAALRLLTPESVNRVDEWNRESTQWTKAIDDLKRGCSKKNAQERAGAVLKLHQAYTTAIMGFDNRAKKALKVLLHKRSTQTN